MQDADRYTTIHYHSYLGLDQLLDAQHLRSGQLDEKPAHEEMLFIIIHQAYELWFKQILHELESILEKLTAEKVDERAIGVVVHRMERVIEIEKLLVRQIGIMETMTPLDFLDFRNYLFPASGFQSFQFRKVENLLGLQEEKRLTYNGCPYHIVFDEQKKQELEKQHSEPSLFDALEQWLERTPFTNVGNWNFLEQYSHAVKKMIDRERVAIQNSEYLSAENKEMRLQMLGNTDTYFQSVLDKHHHDRLRAEGKLRMSYEATIAALLINLYRDEPLFHLPFRMLTCCVEMDDMLTTWRFEHAQMVLRMLGNKIGTGGSSGHAYLNETAVKHPIFRDLHNISTLLIPRTDLPILPDNIKRQLSYFYSVENE